MVKACLFGLSVLAVALSFLPSLTAREPFAFYHLQTAQTVSAEAFTASLARHRFILVGERHTVEGHHRAQLEVIRRLSAGGSRVSIGMEMMRKDSQAALDAWIAGRLSEEEFQAVYRKNWNYPWPLYRPIFVFAREQGIPIIGLNVPPDITRRVAREGFEALSPSQREGLPFVTCRVDEDYLAYIKQAYGHHAHGDMPFEHFCEAQLVWDKAMAANAVAYIEKTPGQRMVILAGTGHARKGGIPRQLESLGHSSYQVVLPEIPAILDPSTLGGEDADFLLREP
jgi:uncharacterized iron-regulated protein